MANHASAKKRMRSSLRAKTYNGQIKSRLRTIERSLRKCIQDKNKDKAQQVFKDFVKKTDQSVSKGVFHRNRANRKKSQMQLLLNAL